MADSEAVRSRRKRRHAVGDHSLCRPARCDGAARAGLSARAGELAEVDAPAELVRLVRRLIAASEADPLNMAVAKELRATLLALPGAAEVDPVTMLAAEVQARAAARRAGLADVVPLSRRAAGGLEDGTGGPGG